MYTATGTPLRVVVAGGGPAALEGALELQALAGDLVRITLLAPDAWFVYRPLAVAEPFGLGHATRFSLPALATERGFAHVRDAVATVDTTHRRLVTTRGEHIAYDALLIAVGARTADALPGALSFGGPADVPALRNALAATRAHASRVAFVAPATVAWTLPLYELAVMTSRWATQEELRVETWLVTHEPRALGLFGEEVSTRIAEFLEDAGVRLWTGAFAEVVEDGRLWLDMEGGLPVDLAVALPRPLGPHIPGVPEDEEGFVPVDAHGVVDGAPGVYAAGDVTTRPLRQGGLAAQQADAAARAIAVQAGAVVAADAYRPALRAILLTGGRPQYLSRGLDSADGEISEDLPWWPPHKITGHRLSPYLAAHPELRGPEPVAA